MEILQPLEGELQSHRNQPVVSPGSCLTEAQRQSPWAAKGAGRRRQVQPHTCQPVLDFRERPFEPLGFEDSDHVGEGRLIDARERRGRLIALQNFGSRGGASNCCICDWGFRG